MPLGGQHVALTSVTRGELPVALGALEGFFAGVDATVHDQRRHHGKLLVALSTLIGLFTGVGPGV